MKKYIQTLFFVLPFAFLGCDTPTNSGTSLSVVKDTSATNEIPAADTSKNTDTEAERNKDRLKGEVNDDGTVLEKENLNDFDTFVLGFDASAVDYYEKGDDGKLSVTWKDTDGTETEFFALLKKHGVNTVRLRIWNNPDTAPEGSDVTGDCNLERLVAMSKRVKKAGLKLMLDFHYSDTWADPSRQIVPAMWKDLTSVEEVENAISEYTTKILRQLKIQADVTPHYVQIGNEINNGLLLHTDCNSSTTVGSGSFSYAGGNSSENVARYLASASKAVRNFNENIKIVVHVTSSNSPTTLLNKLKTGNLDYDVIGLSYYPWENHGTVAQMKNNVSEWKEIYGKDVLIAETSFYCEDNYNGTTYEKDITKLKQAKSNLINPSSNAVYDDLELDSELNYVRGSVENQKKVLVHITDESKDSGAIGVCTWGGEIRDWAHGMFTWEGKAFDSIDFFNNYSEK